jgi:hypothetical protein
LTDGSFVPSHFHKLQTAGSDPKGSPPARRTRRRDDALYEAPPLDELAVSVGVVDVAALFDPLVVLDATSFP